MINYLWGFMIVVGTVLAMFSGKMQLINDGILSSAGDAISLCISMLGIMGMWSGVLHIAKASGLTVRITKLMMPFLCFMFPGIPRESEAMEHIAANIVSNILGLGWAATPEGILAMKELAKEEQAKFDNTNTATDDMCTFLILNVSSVQLIPINMIAYRSNYGSAVPTEIVFPAIAASLASALAGIIFCKIMRKLCNRKQI